MKRQAKLYKEYLAWVKKENAPGLKKYKKEEKESWEKYEQEQKIARIKYEAKLKEYNDKNEKRVKEYESLSYFKKMSASDPRKEIGFGWLNKPRDYSYMSFPPIFMYIPKQKESYEGFMRWLSEVKYK